MVSTSLVPTTEGSSAVLDTEGRSTPSAVPLFRQEVIEFQQSDRQFGQVGLLQPLSLKLTSWLIAGFVALSIVLLIVGQYSRKATVSGYVTPTSGVAKIFALQAGTIIAVNVTEGEEVRKGQALLTIDTTQISASGEDVNVTILQTLANQRDQLNQRIVDEQQHMASERERLTLLIKGLNAGISELRAQIPLQESRISIADSLVDSVAILVKKGAVTDVEFKRRQSEAIDQKQNLNSLKQQLATQQNNLTDATYTLSQLPNATEEKSQLLRNELSTIAQRIAEIKGRQAFVIRSPVSGRVTALQASVGKVAELNRLQLEVVPTDATLRAELLVPSSAIGFVRLGQRVSIRYEAFPHQNFGRYGGNVTEISKDILSEGEIPSAPIALKEPAYRVVASLDRQDIDAYGDKIPLQAGMLLKADIILDRRTLMRWIFDPLLSAKGLN
jgi:membrane fusion protein